MNKNNKFDIQQINFVNDLLKIYGINGLSDFDSKISVNDITDDKIDNINSCINEFKRIFPIKNFNLRRKKYIIDSKTLALAFLKNCLIHIGMNFEYIIKKNKSYLRLKKPSKLLHYYIMMCDIPNKKLLDEATKKSLYLDPNSEVYIKKRTIMNENKERICEHLIIKETITLTKKPNKLYIDDVNIVKKIKLINLPNNYTYNLFLNATLICKSKLCGNYQTFDFSQNCESLRIYQEIVSVPDTYKQFKYQVLNFAKMNYISIDVEKDDPFDSFHIYNKKTKSFFFDEYIIELESVVFNEKNKIYDTINLTKTIYPNNTFIIPHYPGLIEKIMVHDNHLTHILTYFGTILPNNSIYLFNKHTKIETIDTFLDLSNIQKKDLNESIVNKDFLVLLDDHEIHYNTLNFIRNDIKEIVSKENIDSLKITITYHNIAIIDNGKKYLKFCC